MPCRFVVVPCKSCGYYHCGAFDPSKKLGRKKLVEMTCNDDVPDCLVYESAVAMEGVVDGV